MPRSNYDLIVIGAGAGGLGVGIGMARFGFKVLMIDKDKDNFGGECLNTGCVPSKALIHVAEIIAKARESEDYGLEVKGQVDLKKVLQYVYDRQEDIRGHESAEFLQREEGIDVEIGTASFTSRNEVEVNGRIIKGRKILVATGSKPRSLKVKGIEKAKTFTNENLFEIDFIPKKLLVVGAGPIGLEMGQSFSRMGSQVTVMDSSDRVMSKELPEVSALVQERLEKEGLRFLLNHKLQEFVSSSMALLEDAQGQSVQLEYDAVLVGIGREIGYEALKLEKAGVRMDERHRPIIDKRLRAQGNKNIIFAGDAAGNMLFSHAAELHTTILLTNFFTPWPFKKKWSIENFSWVTFTDPEVATFGLGLDEIVRRKIPYQRIDFKFDKDDRAVVSDYKYGRMILFLKKNRLSPRNGKLLGGTVVAPQAGEMVQELIMAKQQGLGAAAIFNKVYPYPTQSRVAKIALVEAFSEGITPVVKRAMKFLFH